MDIPDVELLIGTHSSLIRLSSSDLTPYATQMCAHYYGMTWLPGNTVGVALRRWLTDDRPPEISGTYTHIYEPATGGLSAKPMCFFPISEFIDVHQILYADGGLYVCDCARNSIAFIQGGSELFHFGWPHEVQVTDYLGTTNKHSFHQFDGMIYDLAHPNSVVSFGNGEIAVLLHNRMLKNSEIVYVQNTGNALVEGERVELAHTGCHNLIFNDDGTVYYSASRNGGIVRYDPVTKRAVKCWSADDKHTKGLAKIGDVLVVGISDSAHYQDRFHCQGHIAFLNTVTDETLTLDLGNVGNVNEIMVL